MKPEYNRKARFIAIPTTAGTGAEVTVSAVVSDSKRHLKFSFMNENMVSDLVIIDPELTYGMKNIGSGCDVLCIGYSKKII